MQCKDNNKPTNLNKENMAKQIEGNEKTKACILLPYFNAMKEGNKGKNYYENLVLNLCTYD